MKFHPPLFFSFSISGAKNFFLNCCEMCAKLLEEFQEYILNLNSMQGEHLLIDVFMSVVEY